MGMVKRLLYLIIPYIILSSLAGCKSVSMCLWRLLEPTVFMSTDTSVTAYINETAYSSTDG